MLIEEKPLFELSSPEQRYLDHQRLGVFGAPAVEAYRGGYRMIGSLGYDGEKTPGEIGPIKSYFPDYVALRERSWQLFLESEVAQITINNFITWVIGDGLKIQSEPARDLIEEEIGPFNAQEFSKSFESRFGLFAGSRMADYADMVNLHMIEGEAFKNAIIGGDCLVILRLVDGVVKVELVDGCHVQSPIQGSDFYPGELPNGNKIVHGIELNARKQHVAYYVRKDYRTLEYQRIKARETDGDALMAFMVYGNKYRLDNHRGMPLLSVMFETAKKLERYKEATVGSAEERQKIVMAVEHDIFSTGENPLLSQTVLARDVGNTLNKGLVPRDSFGEEIANRMAVTTKKQVYNLPLGAHLKALESKNELYFKDFYTTNIMLFTACAGIPYEVAMSKYDSNYSASRGAIKDWAHKLKVRRSHFSFQFMKPISEFCLEVWCFQKKIKQYAKYIRARALGDRMLMEAFRRCRFVGPNVPEIDAEKEVKAARLKLGDAGASMPMATLEQVTEDLGGGDSEANLEQYAQELKRSKSLGIKVDEPKPLNGKKPTKKPVKRKV
jgi:capsid protein